MPTETAATPDVTDPGVTCGGCRMHAVCRFVVEADVPDAPAGAIVKHRRSLKRGGYLYRAGDPFHALCAICTGSIKTCTRDIGGGKRVTGFHIAGEVLGLDAVSSGRHACDAVAMEMTSVCEVPFAGLQRLGERIPAVQRVLLGVMGDEILHRHRVQMSLVGKRAAAQRLAAYLVCLSQRFVDRGMSGSEFPLAMSRSDIGNYLGLAKETVTRLFTRLQDQGVISVQARRVRLNDRARLQGLAGRARMRAGRDG